MIPESPFHRLQVKTDKAEGLLLYSDFVMDYSENGMIKMEIEDGDEISFMKRYNSRNYGLYINQVIPLIGMHTGLYVNIEFPNDAYYAAIFKN